MLRGVYAVTLDGVGELDTLIYTVEQALRGGACMIQYRDKVSSPDQKRVFAKALLEVCVRHNKPLIINDDIDIAKETNASGVHLGKSDDSIERARAILGKHSIIGISCYGSLQRAINAQSRGADYVAFGSVFASTSKPNASRVPVDIIKEAKRQLSVPVCAIGGITTDNVGILVKTGVDMVAVISGVFVQPDVAKATESIANYFNQTP